jgi:glutamine amidotransferase
VSPVKKICPPQKEFFKATDTSNSIFQKKISMTVVIIPYNAGNTCSVHYALQRLGVQAILSDDPDTIRRADKVILPGVGAAATAMHHLDSTCLSDVIRSLQQPVLGICLGMQLLCSHSEEGDTPCLGIVDAPVQKFAGAIKIPQMGWNNVKQLSGPLFHGIPEGSHLYFVHSYYVPQGHYTSAVTEYLLPFSASLQYRNFHGVQFHPEKSGATGQRILSNFLNL